MLDLEHPTDAAIRSIGALNTFDKDHQHPDGWTQSVIDKIQLEINSKTPNTINAPATVVDVDHVLSNFSPEERAAWQWYQAEVLPPGKWDKLVDDYEAKGGAESQVDPPPAFDPDKDYVPTPGSKFKPPPGLKVWSGADNTSGNLAVSHEAINFLIRNLGAVAGDGRGILLDARTLLADINPRPGGFARAEVMRQRVRGADLNDPGLQGDTMALLATVHSVLFMLQANLRTLLKNYDEAEEFNTLTSADLGEAMDGSLGRIETLGDYGQTKSIGSGSGGGSTTGGGTGDNKTDDKTDH
jgi:hypothetical protein